MASTPRVTVDADALVLDDGTTLPIGDVEDGEALIRSGSEVGSEALSGSSKVTRYPADGSDPVGYSTLTLALAAASTGDTVQASPGTYSESVSVPDGVKLKGFPLSTAVIIAGVDDESTRVTLGAGCTLREITVRAPVSGSNPAITANHAAGGTILFNLRIEGQGGSGALIQKTGTGALVIALVGMNTGTTTGAILDASAGLVRVLSGGINANSGTANQFLKFSGTVVVEGQLAQVGPPMNLTTMMEIGGTAQVTFSALLSPRNASGTVTNGLHVTSDSVDLNLKLCSFLADTYDVLVDPALAGTGSLWSMNACRFRFERLSAPAGYLSTLAQAVVTYIDEGVENDPAFRVGGELSVGVPARPAESAFGEGDSTVNGLNVVTTDGTGTGNLTDESADAKSSAGSTFSFFQGVTAGHICYIGTFTPTRQFFGIKIDVTTAMVLGGSGVVVWEYWNGSAWTSMRIMATDSNSPYTQRAQQALQNTGGEHVRFDYDTITADWATTTVNSVTGYWVRCRITAAISTAPVGERVKLHTNRLEINEDGFVEYFGKGQPELPLLLHQRLSDDVSGSSPGNATVNFASGVALTLIDNRLAASATDEFGWVRRVQKKQDTSRLITFRAAYVPKSTNTGNVVFRLTYVRLAVGDLWDGSVTTTEVTQTVAQSGTTNQSAVVEFTFAVPDAIAGDLIVFKFGRVGGDAADTYTGNIDIGLIEATGIARSP